MIPLERYYHLEREYLFMDTKEKTAEEFFRESFKPDISSQTNWNSNFKHFNTFDMIQFAEAYAEQKLSALQADPEKRDAATYYQGCQDTFNNHVKPALAKQLDLQENIKSLEAENEELRRKGEWISMKERLPEGDGFVECIVWANWGMYSAMKMARFNTKTQNFIDSRFEIIRGVTHWQPLPSKPEN